ncbi:hypothetical protein LTR15_006841 [Elasticomyces elasticus]|nr:hypothetical protein LTR15_006841 [Elasticomyces elasticus]
MSDLGSPTTLVGDDDDARSVCSRSEFDCDFEDMSLDVHHETAEKDRTVKIVIRDRDDRRGVGMTFDVNYLASFKNAFHHFEAACCRTCKPASTLRFKKGAEVVLPTDTPKKLHLIHESITVFHVCSSMSAGLNCYWCKTRGYPESPHDIDGNITPPQQAPTTSEGDALTLVVEDQTGYKMSVKTMSTSVLEFVMNVYAAQALRDRHVLSFFFDGEKLYWGETGKQLGLIDNDIVTVFIQNIGGLNIWVSTTAQPGQDTWVCRHKPRRDRIGAREAGNGLDFKG